MILPVDFQAQELVRRIGRHVRRSRDGHVHKLVGRNAIGRGFGNRCAGQAGRPPLTAMKVIKLLQTIKSAEDCTIKVRSLAEVLRGKLS